MVGHPEVITSSQQGPLSRPPFLRYCAHPVTTAPRSPIPLPFVRKATLLYFVFVMYSYTTGSPFGLEPQVRNSSPGPPFLSHLLFPLFCFIPVSLLSAALTTPI